MTTPDERQAELLDAYWSALGENRVAVTVPDLDPGIAAAARRLQELRVVGPDSSLALAMRRRFDARLAALPPQPRRLPPATVITPASSWWSLATAAALVLALGISRGFAPTVLPSITNAGSRDPTRLTAMPVSVKPMSRPTPAPPQYRSPQAASFVVIPKPGSAFLGVHAVANTAELDARYGLPATAGAVVGQVIPGGPAARAGLHERDVITAVNDQQVASADDLTKALARYQPGDHVVLTLIRGAQTLQLVVALGSTPK